MDPVIELDGLEVRFGQRVILNRLKAALTGRSIGLLGPNGAGKSTLINTLLGFHKPAAGTARIFGRDIRTHAREVRSLVGYMPENDAFIAGMSGGRLAILFSRDDLTAGALGCCGYRIRGYSPSAASTILANVVLQCGLLRGR